MEPYGASKGPQKQRKPTENHDFSDVSEFSDFQILFFFRFSLPLLLKSGVVPPVPPHLLAELPGLLPPGKGLIRPLRAS